MTGTLTLYRRAATAFSVAANRGERTGAARAALMPWPWPLAGIFKLAPRRVREWLYDMMARNRYRLSGCRAECMVPAPDIRHRLLQTLDDLPSAWKPRKIMGCVLGRRIVPLATVRAICDSASQSMTWLVGGTPLIKDRIVK